MQRTDNLHIAAAVPLINPDTLHAQLPLSDAAAETVASARAAVASMLRGEDTRTLAIVGPCSIHDPDAAREYAQTLKHTADELSEDLLILMRVYFEKPRTTVGWKGLINDPHLDGTHDVATGLYTARRLLLDLAELGLPAASELLDPITPQYTSDLISWVAIGARTTESQTHREMASGLSMPVGFKNATDGGLEVAINAMIAAAEPHSFVGIDGAGQVALLRTEGNPDGHVVLRGGSDGPNYDASSVTAATAKLEAAGICSKVLVDCSHGNSNKDHRNQGPVMREVASQIAAGNQDILGVMIESNLVAGRQDKLGSASDLVRGQSITDACIALDETVALLGELAAASAQRRQLTSAGSSLQM